MGFIFTFLKKKKYSKQRRLHSFITTNNSFREKSTLIKLIKVIKKFSLNSLICIHKISDIKNKFKKQIKFLFKKILNLKLFSKFKI